MQFRENINALRAVAVLSVVLFHFKIAGFGGGFVGVDVFFVISGFLMTGIIFNGLQTQRFSLLAFYAARARRIIPALLALCLALMIFGFVYLALDDYRDLIRTLKSSLLFTSNFTFATNGSYFAAPLHENWLLHTWSLSVEWQFYVVYPLLLMALFRFMGVRGTRTALVVLSLASLIVSIYATRTNPTLAFYMLPTRAWELMAGALVFLFPLKLSERSGQAVEALGLVAIAASIFGFSEYSAWPGYLALLPVLGTALVIYSNTRSAFSKNRLLQFIGRISYSVYLWHWPIVVVLYTCGLLNNWSVLVPAILLSFILGTLSFRIIESRTGGARTTRATLTRYATLTIASVAGAAIVAAVVKDHPEVRFAFKDQNQPQYNSQLYKQECQPSPYGAAECKLGSGEIKAILFGDSHAQATAAAFQLENQQAALEWARGGCPTLREFEMNNQELSEKCRGFNNEKLNLLKNDYHGIPVILFSRAAMYSDQRRDNGYQVYFDGKRNQNANALIKRYTQEYARTVCSIAENHPVYIVKPIPEMPFSIYKGLSLHSRIFNNVSDITISLESYEQRNRIANQIIENAATQCNAQVLDPTPYLCPAGRCMGSREGVSLYFDDNHLVDAGNRLLSNLFKGLVSPI